MVVKRLLIGYEAEAAMMETQRQFEEANAKTQFTVANACICACMRNGGNCAYELPPKTDAKTVLEILTSAGYTVEQAIFNSRSESLPITPIRGIIHISLWETDEMFARCKAERPKEKSTTSPFNPEEYNQKVIPLPLAEAWVKSS